MKMMMLMIMKKIIEIKNIEDIIIIAMKIMKVKKMN